MKNWLAPPLVIAVLFALSGCHCQDIGGTDITIPTSDLTRPELQVTFQMPDGAVITRPTSNENNPFLTGEVGDVIRVPTDGTILISARSVDPQGAKEIKIFAAEKTCSESGATVSCSGPDLLSGPSASSVDTDPPGGKGCTVIQAIHSVDVYRTAGATTASNEWEIWLEGLNFGGQSTRSGFFYLSR
jgi:hypothetical protein